MKNYIIELIGVILIAITSYLFGYVTGQQSVSSPKYIIIDRALQVDNEMGPMLDEFFKSTDPNQLINIADEVWQEVVK